MSVTDSRVNFASRNTDQEEYVRCSCGTRLVYLRREGGRLNMREPFHCTTCHKGGHKACQQCSVCLPASGFGVWGLRSRFNKRSDVVRTDRDHCSSACRQQAYRQRKGVNRA